MVNFFFMLFDFHDFFNLFSIRSWILRIVDQATKIEEKQREQEEKHAQKLKMKRRRRDSEKKKKESESETESDLDVDFFPSQDPNRNLHLAYVNQNVDKIVPKKKKTKKNNLFSDSDSDD